jgi:hypothetical protein
MCPFSQAYDILKGLPCEAWISAAAQLPAKDYYGWSEQVLVCKLDPGELFPTMVMASYDFHRQQWRSSMGEVENVTHWQPLPELPKEYQSE